MDTKICESCGGTIVRERGRHTRWHRVRFCSKQCAATAMRTIPMRSCLRCGRGFRPREDDRRFCSADCWDQWRLGQPGLPDERARGRNRARLWFAPRPCEVCGVTSRPERKGAAAMIARHHRDGDQMNNDPSNIGFMCQPCHMAEHARMRAAGIGRKAGGVRPRIVALMRDRALERFAEAQELRMLGLDDGAIAVQMSVNPWTVKRWFRKYAADPSAGVMQVVLEVVE